ncbi:MAG: hypothetical protein ACRD52_11270 [Candidatus Acidiferrales bacterium]
MRTSQLPLEYLVRASKETLESFELTRLNRAANFRKEARDVLNDWVQAEVESRLARFVLERRRAQSEDSRSLSSESAPPLELELLSSASQFTKSVAEANLISFADPIGHLPESAGTNCLARVHSALPPASAPNSQLSFREFLLGAHFQFELFAGASGAFPVSQCKAIEEIPQNVAKPDRARPARLLSLPTSAAQTHSKENPVARHDKALPARNSLPRTKALKHFRLQFSRRLAAPGMSGVASHRPLARMSASLNRSSAAALLRSRNPFESIGVFTAPLARSHASAGVPSTVHRESHLRCGSFNSSEHSSQLLCSDSESRTIIRANSRDRSAACESRIESNFPSRSNVDCGKFTLASTIQDSHCTSSSRSAAKPSSHHCANLRAGSAIKTFIETLEWIPPRLRTSQVALMRFSSAFDPRFLASTSPDESAITYSGANHPIRVVRSGAKPPIPGSATFCRNSRSGFAFSHALFSRLPITSASFHASDARTTASRNFTTTSLRASNAVVFTARFPSDSRSFLLDSHSFSAGRPLHLSSYFSGSPFPCVFRKIVFVLRTPSSAPHNFGFQPRVRSFQLSLPHRTHIFSLPLSLRSTPFPLTNFSCSRMTSILSSYPIHQARSSSLSIALTTRLHTHAHTLSPLPSVFLPHFINCIPHGLGSLAL